MTFKDLILQDIGIFLSDKEFANVHDIDGQQVTAVVDSDVLKTRNSSGNFEGVYLNQVAVYVKADDLPERPVSGQHLKLDGKLYVVQECSESEGVLEITLGANDS